MLYFCFVALHLQTPDLNGFIPPPLDPSGVKLETVELYDGVFALMSNTPFADNSGFVVGDDFVLVIDAHFTGNMGKQIIDAVKKITDLPIKYWST